MVAALLSSRGTLFMKAARFDVQPEALQPVERRQQLQRERAERLAADRGAERRRDGARLDGESVRGEPRCRAVATSGHGVREEGRLCCSLAKDTSADACVDLRDGRARHGFFPAQIHDVYSSSNARTTTSGILLNVACFLFSVCSEPFDDT